MYYSFALKILCAMFFHAIHLGLIIPNVCPEQIKCRTACQLETRSMGNSPRQRFATWLLFGIRCPGLLAQTLFYCVTGCNCYPEPACHCSMLLFSPVHTQEPDSRASVCSYQLHILIWSLGFGQHSLYFPHFLRN